MLTNSFTFFEKIKLQTYEPVSIDLKGSNFRVFQNLIVRSYVPPPLTSSPRLCGDHAIALTAA